jgi:DNA-binding transcriptional MocR family regulator
MGAGDGGREQCGVNGMPPAGAWTAPRYVQAADVIRAQIADGTLKPGLPVPSGAALARLTGFSQITGRKALRLLVGNGVLVPGPSRNARPRVPPAGRCRTRPLRSWVGRSAHQPTARRPGCRTFAAGQNSAGLGGNAALAEHA